MTYGRTGDANTILEGARAFIGYIMNGKLSDGDRRNLLALIALIQHSGLFEDNGKGSKYFLGFGKLKEYSRDKEACATQSLSNGSGLVQHSGTIAGESFKGLPRRKTPLNDARVPTCPPISSGSTGYEASDKNSIETPRWAAGLGAERQNLAARIEEYLWDPIAEYSESDEDVSNMDSSNDIPQPVSDESYSSDSEVSDISSSPSQLIPELPPSLLPSHGCQIFPLPTRRHHNIRTGGHAAEGSSSTASSSPAVHAVPHRSAGTEGGGSDLMEGSGICTTFEELELLHEARFSSPLQLATPDPDTLREDPLPQYHEASSVPAGSGEQQMNHDQAGICEVGGSSSNEVVDGLPSNAIQEESQGTQQVSSSLDDGQCSKKRPYACDSASDGSPRQRPRLGSGPGGLSDRKYKDGCRKEAQVGESRYNEDELGLPSHLQGYKIIQNEPPREQTSSVPSGEGRILANRRRKKLPDRPTSPNTVYTSVAQAASIPLPEDSFSLFSSNDPSPYPAAEILTMLDQAPEPISQHNQYPTSLASNAVRQSIEAPDVADVIYGFDIDNLASNSNSGEDQWVHLTPDEVAEAGNFKLGDPNRMAVLYDRLKLASLRESVQRVRFYKLVIALAEGGRIAGIRLVDGSLLTTLKSVQLGIATEKGQDVQATGLQEKTDEKQTGGIIAEYRKTNPAGYSNWTLLTLSRGGGLIVGGCELIAAA